jgi:RHS repeat-associated protein
VRSTPGLEVPHTTRGIKDDLNGNRTSYSSAATGTIAGTYDDQDRLLTYGDLMYTYGANGELESKVNTVTGDTWLYQYDALGNLLSVTLPSGDLIEYLVDGHGRRVARKLNGVVTNRWLYQDGLRPIAELNPTGTLIAAYVYGTKSNVPDMIIRQGKFYRVLSDQLGSPRLVVDTSDVTNVPFKADYSAFGHVTGTGLDWMPFGFAGGIYDAATGLVRFGARDYDASVGRWTSKEPLRFTGGKNFYVYADVDPINKLDPDGRIVIVDDIIILGGAIIVTGIAIWAILQGNQENIQKIKDACEPKPIPKEPDEICPLSYELNWECVYYCPVSKREVKTRRIAEEFTPPANDICPPSIVLTG